MIASVEQIKQKAVKEVEILGFEQGEFITLQLKGISMTNLIQSGKIPNALMGTAIELFEGSKKDKKDEKNYQDKIPESIKMIDIFCEGAMVEPKYEDVKEYLTDAQKMEIFTFAQGGVMALENFRKNKTMPKLNTHGNDISQSTEPTT